MRTHGMAKRRRLSIGAIVTMAAISLAVSHAQAPTGRGGAPGTAAVNGRVLDVASGAAIAGAQVRLTGERLRQAIVSATDVQGRFEFKNLAPGSYAVSGGRNGYVTLSYGQRRAFDPPRPIELAEGQQLSGVDLRLPKAGAIAVRVTDHVGEPIAGATAGAYALRFNGDQPVRTLNVAGRTGGMATGIPNTDDRGQARIYGLAPGEYYVFIKPGNKPAIGRGEQQVSWLPTYFPGTPAFGEAQRVMVGAGQTKEVMVTLVTGPVARINGLIRASDGSPSGITSVSLQQFAATGATGDSVPVRPDGRFTVDKVLPGDYVIVAGGTLGRGSNPAQEQGFFPITVTERNVENLVLTTSKGGTASGRVMFDGAPPASLQPSAIPVLARAIDVRLANTWRGNTTAKADWTFEISGLAGDRVFRLGPGPADRDWILKSVTLDGRDITDTPLNFDAGRTVKGLEMVLTQAQSTIGGTATNSRGAAVEEYAVIVFPDDEQQWTPHSRFIAAGRANQDGRFSITGLPAGRYLAAALELLEDGEERDPQLLKSLQLRATPISLGEAQRQAVTLRLAER